MDEADVILRCQEGDREAFRFVVERYGKVLYGTAYMMTRERDLAEDLVQEAFILAWRNISSFRVGTNFRAWLLRILVNRTISEQRKKRVMQIDLEEHSATLSVLDQGEETVLQEEERERIRQCLETLPQDQREAIVLRYYTDLTVPEIAAALGWRQGTVKSRLHRGLARLRLQLRDNLTQQVSICDVA